MYITVLEKKVLKKKTETCFLREVYLPYGTELIPVDLPLPQSRSGADFTKGLSPVSDSNFRLLSQIIGIFYLSPWAQP